jgi:lysozyme
MNRPKLTREELIDRIKGYAVPEAVKLIGIRGYYKNTMGKAGENDRGIYDDAIFLLTPNLFLSFNANTDPSKHKSGIAKLIPGVHYFKKGKHGISKPGGGYHAFRPNTPDESLPVTRDGLEGIKKGIAINIHKGGYSTTGSAGCQTIFPDQWLQFVREVYHAMDLEGQKSIPYILIEQ